MIGEMVEIKFGWLTFSACHEMLNFLHVISGYIQLFLTEPLSPRLSRRLSTIQERSDRMLKIVKNLACFMTSQK